VIKLSEKSSCDLGQYAQNFKGICYTKLRRILSAPQYPRPAPL